MEIAWRNLLTCIHVYMCRNQSNNLNQELLLRGIDPNTPITLIPVTLIETPLQVVQGALHYKLYINRVKRVRNQGLALASLIIGVKQLDDLISAVSSKMSEEEYYYIVSVDEKPRNIEDCIGVDVTNVRSESLKALVKNARFVLSIT